MPALWLWRWPSHHFSARAILMLACAALGLSVLPLGIACTVTEAMLVAVFIGIALAGLILKAMSSWPT